MDRPEQRQIAVGCHCQVTILTLPCLNDHSDRRHRYGHEKPAPSGLCRDGRPYQPASRANEHLLLTLNTAIFTAVGLFWEHKPEGQVRWLIFPLAMLLGQCFAWFYLLRSYRLLNTAKYEVVGALETRLPSSPYWSAEWTTLGGGEI